MARPAPRHWPGERLSPGRPPWPEPAAAPRSAARQFVSPGAGEPWGIYAAVPFCRAKCSFCNFASGVFSPALWPRYLAALEREVGLTLAAVAPGTRPVVDTIYCGGGTPTLLAPADLMALAETLRGSFSVAAEAEFTCEAMPGTVDAAVCAAMAEAGINRVSLGVQSWLPEEARRVGRNHSPASIHSDLARLRACGLGNLSLDLIAGLPRQTAASWRESVRRTVDSGVPHVSVYLFELDAESRLGGEILAGGTRYGAAEMPDPDETADWYEAAAETLGQAGLAQYEISNFARPGFASRHNERYWLRRPYLGFGLEAHSFLRAGGAVDPIRPSPAGAASFDAGSGSALRWGNTAAMEEYLAAVEAGRRPVEQQMTLTPAQQLEEALFLGLRRNAGVEWAALREEFGDEPVESKQVVAAELAAAGCLDDRNGQVALTARGRLLANEVFERFLA